MSGIPGNASLNLSSAVSWSLNASCRYIPSDNLQVKFILLVVITPILCAYGIFGSFLAICVFIKVKMRNPNNCYLTALAVCDIGVLTTAVLIYSVEIIYDYNGDYTLYYAWVSYLSLVYFLSHLFQVGAVYMTVAATVERWLALAHPHIARKICDVRKTLGWIGLISVLSVAFTFTKYLEIDTIYRPWCTGFKKYALFASKLAQDDIYTLVHTIWLSGLFVIFIPFLLLLVLNTIITFRTVNEMRRPLEQPRTSILIMAMRMRVESRIYRMRRREANVILLVIVMVFLVCNIPDFILTLWEQVDIEWLRAHGDIYSFGKDLVNLLTIVNSSANFTVYCLFGADFRRELRCNFRLAFRGLRWLLCELTGFQSPKGSAHKASINSVNSPRKTNAPAPTLNGTYSNYFCGEGRETEEPLVNDGHSEVIQQGTKRWWVETVDL